MQPPPPPEADLKARTVEEACTLAKCAATLLYNSSMWLHFVTTLGGVSYAMSESFGLAAATALDSLDKDNPRVSQSALPRFVALVDLGRTVTHAMSQNSATLANLLGKNSISYLPREASDANTLAALNTEFRNIFARLSLLEANLDPIGSAAIHKGVISLRNQHDKNASIACDTAREVEKNLGIMIRILRLLEFLVSDVR